MINEIRYNSILVPIDGSNKSFNAVKYALKLALFFRDCSITICHIINKDKIKQISMYEGLNIDQLEQKYIEQGEKYCRRAEQEAKIIGFDDKNIESKILLGDPVEEIIKMAPNFDIIVIAARGKQHITDYIIGHVTDRVIRLSEVPVLIVP
ncbi:MAG: universal stress protein [Promethearchaeota archaeon]